MIAGLDHVTINTSKLAQTQAFYIDIVGLELAPRPNLGVPGIWLQASTDSPAIVHILEVKSQTHDVDNGTEIERPNVDHIAFHAKDFAAVTTKISEYKLPWRGNVIADFGLWQLMFYDPNGVLIEMNFKAKAETSADPTIPAENQINGKAFFNAAIYPQF